MRRIRAMWVPVTIALALALGLATFACTSLRVATGYTSHVLCSGTFVSGLDPDAVYRESVAPRVRPVSWGLHHRIDREKKDVRVTFLGGAESHAVYREGLGCLVERGGPAADFAVPDLEPTEPSLAPIAGDAVVAPRSEALRLALEHAFAE